MKKILFALAVAVCAISAQASYLYWQVDTGAMGITAENSNYYFNGHQITGINFMDVESGTVLNAYDVADGYKATGMDMIQYSDSTWVVDLNTSGATGYAFYVELIGYDNAVYGADTGTIGVTATYEASTMKEYIGSSLHSVPAAIWHGGAVAAPEPTSAMMILLGLAGLALKRKQV